MSFTSYVGEAKSPSSNRFTLNFALFYFPRGALIKISSYELTFLAKINITRTCQLVCRNSHYSSYLSESAYRHFLRFNICGLRLNSSWPVFVSLSFFTLHSSLSAFKGRVPRNVFSLFLSFLLCLSFSSCLSL